MPGNTDPKIIIRPATSADAATITQIIRQANINPMGLDWRRFLVAEEGGRIIGTGQIKPHGDGSRELASIAVIPERQKQGIASDIILALFAQYDGVLHLMCESSLQPFYERFGFHTIHDIEEMPRYFRRMVRLVNVIGPAARLFGQENFTLSVMVRPANTAPDKASSSGG